MKPGTKTFLSVTALLISIFILGFRDSGNHQVRKILIEVGHGGQDGGIVTPEVSEAEILQSIGAVLKAKAEKQTHGITFSFVSGDESLKNRIAKVQQTDTDLVVSLHLGFSDDRNVAGIHAVVSPKSAYKSESYEFAVAMLENLETYSKKLTIGNTRSEPLSLLTHAKAPAVCLELGFLSNSNDLEFLKDPQNHSVLAEAIWNCFLALG